MLDLEFAGVSDAGTVRGHNEDYIGQRAPGTAEEARSRGWLFALADGVGGEEYGEVASRTAVDALLSSFDGFRRSESPSGLLERLVQAANLKVYETGAAARPGGSSMCTTLVACLLRYDRAAIAHVGDSRCYLIRRGVAKVLTGDHTLIGEQLRMGLISPEEAAVSERRHLLSRSLGADMFVNPELNEHQLLAGDLLLLSSDGLHAAVNPREMAAITAKFHDLTEAARNLVSLAREKDGGDNISIQLIRIKDVERVGMYRGRPYRLRQGRS